MASFNHIDWCESNGKYLDDDCSCPCPCDIQDGRKCSKHAGDLDLAPTYTDELYSAIRDIFREALHPL